MQVLGIENSPSIGSRIYSKICRELNYFINLTISSIKHACKYGFLKKKKTVYTHITFNLGDNLIHINYIKRLALANPLIQFVHYTKDVYMGEIIPYVSEVPNIGIRSLNERPYYSLNAWKNLNNFWDCHDYKYDFCRFYIDFFEKFSKKLGLENVIKKNEDFEFDGTLFFNNSKKFNSYDYLIVNSIPLSGQFYFDDEEFNQIIRKIAEKYTVITTRKVDKFPCTADSDMSVVDIASLSIRCTYHLMVSTGPSWYVLNNFNFINSKEIVLFVKDEFININKKIRTSQRITDFILK